MDQVNYPQEIHYPPAWAKKVCTMVGGQSKYEILFTCWGFAEGTIGASYNPINTTLPLMGSSAWNTAGVQNYSSSIIGMCATAITLQNGYYNGILGAIQGGKLTPIQVVEKYSNEFSTWGTNPQDIIAELRVHGVMVRLMSRLLRKPLRRETSRDTFSYSRKNQLTEFDTR